MYCASPKRADAVVFPDFTSKLFERISFGVIARSTDAICTG